MKKGYKKPQIFIEQFELIEQISTACESEYQTHGHYYNSCSYVKSLSTPMFIPAIL